MPLVNLPINENPYESADNVELADVGAKLYNCYVNEMGHTIRRPGYTLFATIPNVPRVDSLYWWPSGERFFAVADKRMFEISREGAVTEILAATDYTGALNTGKTTWADNGTYAAFANHSPIHLIGMGETAYKKVGDVDAPTNVSHVGYIDQYIVANEVGTGRFHWSNVTAVFNWSAVSFNTAETLPDPVSYLGVAWREIMLIGPRTCEPFYNDGVTPFIRMSGAHTERGTIAPNSVIFCNGTYYFLDQYRQIVRLQGRATQTISSSIDKILQSYQAVADCQADYFPLGGQHFLLFNFLAQSEAQVYNIASDKWQGQWTHWDSNQGIHTPWIGYCHDYSDSWNKHLMGSRTDGKIYVVSPDYYNDNGVPIVSTRRTGWINHGTSVRKRSSRLTFKLKMGYGSTSVGTDPSIYNPHLMVKWRDDGNLVWGAERWVDLKQVGNYEFYATLYQNGAYRSRQYEITMSDTAYLVLCDAEEEVVVMLS